MLLTGPLRCGLKPTMDISSFIALRMLQGDWNARAPVRGLMLQNGPCRLTADQHPQPKSLSQGLLWKQLTMLQSQLILAAILFQSIERWAFVVANKLPDCPILNVHKQKGTDLCIEVLQVSKSKYWKLVVSISWWHCIYLL